MAKPRKIDKLEPEKRAELEQDMQSMKRGEVSKKWGFSYQQIAASFGNAWKRNAVKIEREANVVDEVNDSVA